MISIASVTLTNFGRFRGTHTLNFHEGTYAIVGERVDNALSSNWAGKTSLLDALGPFPLFGKQSFSDTEDGWISRGEKEGGVQLVLAARTSIAPAVVQPIVIERSRARGSATRLVLTALSGKESSTGDVKYADAEAQAQIEQLIGLSYVDFLNTRFFEQKQMSRFVVTRPAERQAIVTEWLQLGPLVLAGGHAQSTFASELERQRSRDAAIASLRERVTSRIAAEHRGKPVDGETIEAWFEEHLGYADEGATLHNAKLDEQMKIETKWATTEALQKEIDKRNAARARALVDSVNQKQRLDEVRKEIASLEAKTTDAASKDLKSALDDAVQKENELRGKLRSLKTVAAGDFDGTCPVSPGFTCPAKVDINARRTENRKALEQLTHDHAAADKDSSGRVSAWSVFLNDKGALADLRVEEAKLAAKGEAKADVTEGNLPVPDEPRPSEDDIDEHRAYLADFRSHRKDLTARRDAWRIESAELRKLIEEGSAGAIRVETYRAGAVLFKRAQRAIAETELLRIEGRANTILIEQGIDLGVRVTWVRETNALATACDACGQPFPASTKVKRCERCAAERGPKLSEQLELELTDRSGAAEDLAGIALQFSASEWLAEHRDMSFAPIFLDEPFGSLDRANARALASFVSTKLAPQVFVTAHDHAIMDAIPNRITVVGDGAWSKVTVDD